MTMWVRKITTGYVVQVLDTETGEWISQEFTAAYEPEYEDENGNKVEPFEDYLEFNMVQPSEAYPDGDIS
jgi:hypothetical protein